MVGASKFKVWVTSERAERYGTVKSRGIEEAKLIKIDNLNKKTELNTIKSIQIQHNPTRIQRNVMIVNQSGCSMLQPCLDFALSSIMSIYLTYNNNL